MMSYNRTLEALAYSLLLAVAFVVLFSLSGCQLLRKSIYNKGSNQAIRHHADVLILGAGMAGIAAGYTLASNGTTNFIILEAGEKIGGRVKSKVLEISGVRIELGANWIQGIDPVQPEKHPLYSIAQECGGVEGFFMRRELSTTFHFYDSNGEKITTSKKLRQRIDEWYKLEVILNNEATRRRKDGLPDISVRDTLNENGWVPQSPMDRAIEWVGIDYVNEYTPENISLKMNFPDDTYSEFGDPSRTIDFFITDQKTGYAGVIQCLADRYLTAGDPRLHLNSVVKEIEWSDSCVCVSAMEGSSLKQYCAPYAIVTFSVGALKARTAKFTPELPKKKQDAIDNLYVGLFVKIYLEFDETFWQDDVNYIIQADPEKGHFCHFQSLTQNFPGRSNVLMATVTGKWATTVYTQTESETKSQIMEVLQRLYGSKIPEPVGITIPDWGVNPFFMGMYSDYPPGYEQFYEDLLSRAGCLYFSGEAMTEKFNAYVHGAYFSGIDTANQVISSLKHYGKASTQLCT